MGSISNNNKKKKIGACLFWAPYFFGGKMEHIWTDVTNRITKKKQTKKNWSMRNISAVFFLAGKFLTCEQPMPWIISQQKKLSPTKLRNYSCLLLVQVVSFLWMILGSNLPYSWEKGATPVLYLWRHLVFHLDYNHFCLIQASINLLENKRNNKLTTATDLKPFVLVTHRS